MRIIAVLVGALLVLAGCGATKQGDEKLIIQPPSCDNPTIPPGVEQIGTFDYGPQGTNLAVSEGLELTGGHIKKAEIGLDLQVYGTSDRATSVRNYSDGYSVTVQWADGCVATIVSDGDKHGITFSSGSGTATLYKPAG